MKTQSEIIFEKYCEIHNYAAEKIRASSSFGKVPDYEVLGSGSKFIVEIKELTPNEDDIRQAHEISKRIFKVRGHIPGRRIYEKIKTAARQLSRFRNSGLPCVLLLYDNIVVDGFRIHHQGYLLESTFIDYGMYGSHSVILNVADLKTGENPKLVGDTRGGDRQLTKDERTYISAVSVLYAMDNTDLFIWTYHNTFAKVKLPLEVFPGRQDRHYIKPQSNVKNPQIWEEIIRAST